MPSPIFLTSYVLFSAALRAYQEGAGPEENEFSEQEVLKAYEAATSGITTADLTAFNGYVDRLFKVPRKLRVAAYENLDNQRRLDWTVRKGASRLYTEGRLLDEDEFISSTGMTKEILLEKLQNREIFRVDLSADEHFSEEEIFIPTFFADQRYKSQSLYKVSRALRALTGAQKYRFFITPIPGQTDRTPLDLIEQQQADLLEAEVRVFRAQLRKPKMG